MRKSLTFIFSMVLLMFSTTLMGQKRIVDYSAQTQQLASAVKSGNLEAVKKVYSHPAVQGIDPVTSLRPLHLASKMGHYEVVAFLLDQEKEMESGIYVTREEMPPMVHAIKNGHSNIVELLLKKGNRKTNNTWMNKTYLFHALDSKANQAIIDVLINNGSDMKLAKQGMKLEEKLAKDISIVKRWSNEINGKITLNRYQKIDVWNLNIKASNMLIEMRDKYGVNSTSFNQEASEILEWRLKKLRSIIPSTKFTQLGTLSKQ